MADYTLNRRHLGSLTNDQHQDSSLTSVMRSFMAQGEPAWTPGLVEWRLRKAIAVRAAVVDGHMAGDRARGLSPESIGIIGGIGSAPENDGGHGVVDMATEALSWLRWLEADDAGIVGARLEGVPWKSICWRYGVSRPTADRRFRYALALIAWYLNECTGSKAAPSMRKVLGLNRRA